MIIRDALAMAAALAVTLGSAVAGEQTEKAVTIVNAWARATPAGATVGAAYLDVRMGGTGDRLIGVASPVAGRAELHSHSDENGVMRMRRLEAVAIRSGEAHAFVPGGDHIMLFDLKEPLHEGGSVPLTLSFERAGDITVEAPIIAIGAQGPASSVAPTAGGTHEH